MNQFIEQLCETLRDYQVGDNQLMSPITPERVRNWITQFREEERELVLSETCRVIKALYVTRERAVKFLEEVLEVLTEDFGFNSSEDLLKNTDLLFLQEKGKSQDVMLEMMEDLIKSRYSMTLKDCGVESKKVSLYLDDVLCSGNTLFGDIKKWSEARFSASMSI